MKPTVGGHEPNHAARMLGPWTARLLWAKGTSARRSVPYPIWVLINVATAVLLGYAVVFVLAWIGIAAGVK